MISVKCFVLLLLLRFSADATGASSSADLCHEGAGDFAVARGKDGSEESLELLQVKQAPCQHNQDLEM